MYSKQQTFNRVVKHLRGMTERSMNDVIGCAYRGDDGRKCAVGCLIPDSLYDETMEGLGAQRPIMRDLLNLAGHDADLCSDLQQVHDREEYFADREFYLACVAEKHGLRMPDLEDP